MMPLIVGTTKQSTNRKSQTSSASFPRKTAWIIKNSSTPGRGAVRTLKKEDHYLLALIAAAGASGRPRGDLLKLLAAALVIVGVFVVIVLLATRR
jgi:hypothetical protein